MKKIFISLIVFIQILLIAFPTTLKAQNQNSKNVIFLIDLSASMNKNNLFQDVKTSIQEALKSTVNPGDKVYVYGFDEKVYIIDERQISKGLMDVFQVNTQISKLKANGNWTYITSALETAAKKLELLNSESQNSLKIVYLFTDGINDPPPYLKNPITYDDLINKYFSTYTKKNTFMYVFKFGVNKKDVKEKKWIDTTGAQVGNALSIVSLQPYSFSKKYKEGEVNDIQLEVSWLQNMKNPLKIKFISENDNLKILKDSQDITINKVGQKFKIYYKGSNLFGTNDTVLTKIKINSPNNNNTEIVPPEIKLKLIKSKEKSVKKKVEEKVVKRTDDNSTMSTLLKILFLIIILLVVFGLVYIICKFLIPKFKDTNVLEIKAELTNYEPIQLYDYNKLCFSKITVGDGKELDVNLNEVNFELKPTKHGIIINLLIGELNYYDAGEQKILTENESYEFTQSINFTTNSNIELKFTV